MGNNIVRRITKNALLLAIMCVLGMVSIPLGANIKLSLQLLVVYIICLISESVIDCLIITSLYLAIGLFIPIYAGFNAGVSPTFGYVISFILICPIIFFLNKLPIKNQILRMSLACFSGLIVCYIVGTIFMVFYLELGLGKTLLISVVPYIPFDLFKIFLAISTIILLPNNIKSKKY